MSEADEINHEDLEAAADMWDRIVADKVPEKPVQYDVIVGNVGAVLSCTDLRQAMATYLSYVSISKDGVGRAGGESVTLMADCEPIREHLGSVDQ